MRKLVIKAQSGDVESFLELFQLYKHQLYRVAFVYTKNKEDSLDVIQETAYCAFKNISTLKKPKFFKTWIIRITINCALNILKSKKHTVHYETNHLENLSYVNEDVPLNISIEQLLSTLNHKEKTVIILKFYFDYTFKQISETMELPSGSVKSLYYRSLEKLRNNAERKDYYEK
ncbi:sigma-70 family RNA polymerase sigma factor [Ornithinibacillus sp. L9]|uniref:Sigma-70 family RNA polymerase sigma factor n=1 Tax=Ornithinibacillus caprae TaxID=2678566 RepID=A0A6N8FFL9_9BACI|nr:sigma-70 family RNA polymerase sigma factor [Ornithinibacillus caprae]